MCNGICYKFAITKNPFRSMFGLGFVRCSDCECFLESQSCKKNNGGSLICPCCRYQVRTSPRNKKAMIKVRIWIKFKSEKKEHLTLQNFKMKKLKRL